MLKKLPHPPEILGGKSPLTLMMPAYKSSQSSYCTLAPPIFINTVTDVFADLPVEIYQIRIDGYIGTLSRRFNEAKYLSKSCFI